MKLNGETVSDIIDEILFVYTSGYVRPDVDGKCFKRKVPKKRQSFTCTIRTDVGRTHRFSASFSVAIGKAPGAVNRLGIPVSEKNNSLFRHFFFFYPFGRRKRREQTSNQ